MLTDAQTPFLGAPLVPFKAVLLKPAPATKVDRAIESRARAQSSHIKTIGALKPEILKAAQPESQKP